MYGMIKDWIVTIVMAILFLTLVDMILPSGGLKKYTRLVTGLIVVLVIMKPVFIVFGSGGVLGDSMGKNLERYRDVFGKKEGTARDAAAYVYNPYNGETLNAFKKNMIKKIEQEINSGNKKTFVVNRLFIEDRQDSEAFLKVKLIEIKEEDRGQKIGSVEKIDINSNTAKPGGNETDGIWDKGVAGVLVDNFGIDPSSIRFVR